MTLGLMLLTAFGATALFSAVTLLRVWKASGKPGREVVAGAILQAAFFGAIIGFLALPNAPAPPAVDKAGLWFVGAIVLIEVVRSGVYLRLPFVPKALLSYRLQSLRIKRQLVNQSIEAFEGLLARRNPPGAKSGAGTPAA